MPGAFDWASAPYYTIGVFMNLGPVSDVADFETVDSASLFFLRFIEAMARRVRPGHAHRDVLDAAPFSVDAGRRTRLPDGVRDPADRISGDSPPHLLPVFKRGC
jgi:hypothetical protein